MQLFRWWDIQDFRDQALRVIQHHLLIWNHSQIRIIVRLDPTRRRQLNSGSHNPLRMLDVLSCLSLNARVASGWGLVRPPNYPLHMVPISGHKGYLVHWSWGLKCPWSLGSDECFTNYVLDRLLGRKLTVLSQLGATLLPGHPLEIPWCPPILIDIIFIL
jgi:hypothetical protein